MRGTLDAVALAEKLVHDLDKPKSEVVVDVIVMQANSERTRESGRDHRFGGHGRLEHADLFPCRHRQRIPRPRGTPHFGASGATGTTHHHRRTGGSRWARLAHLPSTTFRHHTAGALLNAMLTDTKTKVLNTPQVRASDGQKVELKIGEPHPVRDGKFSAGVGTVRRQPLVSTQFNYADVGVNVDITPQVHSARSDAAYRSGGVRTSQYCEPRRHLAAGDRPEQEHRRYPAARGRGQYSGRLSQTSDSKRSRVPGSDEHSGAGQVSFGSTNTDKQNNRTDDRADSAYRADAGLLGGEFARNLRGQRSGGEDDITRRGRRAAAARCCSCSPRYLPRPRSASSDPATATRARRRRVQAAAPVTSSWRRIRSADRAARYGEPCRWRMRTICLPASPLQIKYDPGAAAAERYDAGRIIRARRRARSRGEGYSQRFGRGDADADAGLRGHPAISGRARSWF